MADDYAYARTMAQLHINRQKDAGDGTLTEQMITDSVEQIMASGLVTLSPTMKSSLINELMSSFQTWVGKIRVIVGEGSHRPWLSKRRGEIDWKFWDRYSKMLVQDGWRSQLWTSSTSSRI